jgi:hypothetical protein
MPSVSLGFLLLSGFSAHNMPLFPLQGPAQAQNLRDSLADAKSDIVVKVSSSLVVTIIHTCKTTTTKRSGVGFFFDKNKTKPILCFGEKSTLFFIWLLFFEFLTSILESLQFFILCNLDMAIMSQVFCLLYVLRHCSVSPTCCCLLLPDWSPERIQIF